MKSFVSFMLVAALVFACAAGCSPPETPPEISAVRQPSSSHVAAPEPEPVPEAVNDEPVADEPLSSSQPLSYDIGQVLIISSNEEFEPYEHFVSSEIVIDGQLTYGCGTFLSLEEVSKSLPEIQYADDLQVIVEGEDAGAATYSLYNDEFENLYSNRNDLSIPGETGIYLLFVEVTWSNEEAVQQYKEYTSIEYLFKVKV